MWDNWNFKVDVLGKGKKRLAAAVSLFFDKDSQGIENTAKTFKNEEFTKWVSFKKDGVAHIALFAEETPEKYHSWNEKFAGTIPMPLPYKLDEKAAVEFLWSWLKSLDTEAWGDEPDCDGSVARECFNVKSVEVYISTALVLKPVWAEYHK